MLINKIEKSDIGFRYHFTSNTPTAPSLAWYNGKPHYIPAEEDTFELITTANKPPDELRILEIATMGTHLGGMNIQWYHDGDNPLVRIEIYNPSDKLVHRATVVTNQHGYYDYSWQAKDTGFHKVDIIPVTEDGKVLYPQVISHKHYAKPVPKLPNYKITPIDDNTVKLETI